MLRLGATVAVTAALAGGGLAADCALSPCALVASSNGSQVYVACASSGEVIEFDLSGQRIRRRTSLPGSPSGLALSADGQRLFVTCAAPQSRICVFDVPSFKIAYNLATGHTALAPVLSRDEKTLFVCNRFDNAVAVLDLERKREVARIPVEREPVSLALTPDGELLFAANHLHAGPADVGVVTATVSAIDVRTRKVLKHIPLTNGSTLLRDLCVSPDGRYLALAHNLAHFHLPTTTVELGWMNANALSLIDTAELKLVSTLSLDRFLAGAATPWATAWSADGKFIYVTHAGTHELSVIDAPALLAKLAPLPFFPERADAPSPYFGGARSRSEVPTDFRFLTGMRTRIKLPGNGPRAIAIAGERVLVAEYFSDSIALVSPGPVVPGGLRHADEPRATVSPKSIPLRPAAAAPSLARLGEMYFNDATLCFQGWQSCASCHSADARVDGLDWDLQNDGVGNPKNVRSLLLSFQTPPVMSMGVRADAATAIRAGLRFILFTNAPPHYAEAIDEYVRSLKPVPSPALIRGQLSPAARRGRKLFSDPAIGCVQCHPPPLFTDLKSHPVAPGKFDGAADRFYTPTLVEVWRTGPWLHDGSAASLEDVLTRHNPQDRRGHTSQLTHSQIDDLTAYVRSL